MKRIDHLLVILMEECNEVSQRAAKALRFGTSEIQPGQELTNASRIRLEMLDLLAVADMLRDEGITPFNFASNADMHHMRRKREKVEAFLTYSHELGRLDTDEDRS